MDTPVGAIGVLGIVRNVLTRLALVGALTLGSTAVGLLVTATPPAGAATTGSISGTVTDAITGTPLSGICVDAIQTGDGGGSQEVLTSNGAYTMSGLPVGTYDVEFTSGPGCGGANYETQWYNGQTSQGTATPVTVTGGITADINAAMQIPEITGTVTAADGVTPLGGICVSASQSGGVGYGQTTTAADGTYSITNLPTGSYTVDFFVNGAGGCGNTSNLAPQSVASVSVTAGQTTSGIDASMQPGGTITGTVTEAGGGALVGICVTATPRGSTVPSPSVTTASGGTYTIEYLSTGTYTLEFFANGCPGSTANVLSQAVASVSVTAGQSPTVSNASMQPAGAISGTVTAAVGGGAEPGICVTAIQSGSTTPSGTAPTATDGTYTIDYLPTGTYTVDFVVKGCGSTANLLPQSVTSVAVTAGSTTSGVDAAMEPAGSISGTVTASGGAGIQGICVIATLTTLPGAPFSTTTGATGGYSIGGLPAGSYTVEFSGCGAALGYGTQWYDDQSSASSANTVTVTAGNPTPNINAAMLTGSISGTVTDASNGGVPLGYVYVTATQTGGGAGTGSTFNSPSNGSYTISGLPAGSYTVDFQFEGFSGSYAEQWYNDQPTASTATAVTVVAGQITSNIDAAMVTPSDPGAPTIGTATAGNASATVTWTAPASNGGSAITGYLITPYLGSTAQTAVPVGDVTSGVVTGLTNGDAYTFKVAAENDVGTGPASAASNAVTPAPTAPGAPTIGTATAGGGTATVTWSAPASNGGSSITGYVITPYLGSTAQTAVPVGDVTSDVVTGLTNGDTYTFTVAAKNVVGTGPASTASNTVTPGAAPGAPTIGTATAGNASATVTWTAPASNGGSSITGYVITPYIGNTAQTAVPVGDVTSDVVTGLTNGDAYTFTVAATNSIGEGLPSAASNPVTPATVPGAPTIGTATAGNASASVTWTAPASNGGSSITGYVITPYIGSTAQTAVPVGDVTSDVVTGLTNGDAYTFTVTATNGVGPGPASAASNPVTPATVPGAPTIGTATAGNASATVTWTAPASNGGSSITEYVITPYIGSTAQTAVPVGDVTSDVVTGLTNGDAYTFTVTATNGVGPGPASAASNPVTPATVPGAPTSVSAARGNAQATVTWTAPASNGGSSITEYVITPYIGSTAQTAVPVGDVTSDVVTGLTNGDAYTFTVTATNGVGPGPASAASNPVTPATVPGAPTSVSAARGNAQATVTWTAPASNGSAITSYTVTAADSTTSTNGGQTCGWTTGPLGCTVTGLTNGDSYTFTVAATNGVGTGPVSAGSNPVTPATVPGEPTGVSATRGNAQATVTWTAPASNGSAITSYTVTAADSTTPGNGGQTCLWTTGSLSCTVTNLTNGDSYTFTVTATNAVGPGPVSAGSNAVTPATVPGAPTGVSATRGNAQATVTWTAPASNGSAITSYTVTAADSTTPGNGGQTCGWTTGSLSCTVTGLTNGDAYTFTVTATNGVGPGPASAASNPVTPATVPGAPTSVSAARGNAQATVTWTAPASNGSAITSYTVTAADSTTPGNGGQTCGWTTGPLSCTVAKLTNGDSYTFTVTATNAAGPGPASAASNPVVPMTVPGAPTIGTATGGNASAIVTWTAPSSDGGSAITSYTVTAADSTTPGNGGQTCGWTTGPLICTLAELTNGDSYTFTVTATNSVGTGGASAASNAVVPAPTAPDAPTIGTATGGNTTAIVTWTAPASDGGSTITGYTVTATDATTPGNGGESCSWTTGPLGCTVTGLTNGDSYTFTVTATNGAGIGPASAASNPVVPMTVPGAPTISTATGGNTTAIVTWTAPASDGGSLITGYTVTAADATTPGNGGESCSWTTGPLTCTVIGLTNGDSYTFTVTATNGAGIGAASAASNPVVPMTVPGAPTIGTATGGNTTAIVTWTAPVSDGGNSITGYTVTAADATTPGNGGESCSWTTGPLTCTVTGLTNGDSYTFTVTATNGAGIGAASAASNAVVPMTDPGAPTIGTATGGNTTAIVTWTAPASDGGSAITGYTVTATDATTPGNGGESCSWTTGPLGCTVTGLTNGDSYTFTVTATNSVGTGGASAASNAVTPAPTAPDAPTIGTATGADVSAAVTWSAPASDGGSPISAYTVTATDSTTPANGGETCGWTTGPLSCTVAKLTNGDSYTFSVTATNGVGTGPASAASNPVVPMAVPDAPTIGTATGENASAIVTWSAPVSDGGNSINAYTVTATDSTTLANGGETCGWTTGPLSCTVAKLTNGDSYTFTVTATNSVGTGGASAASNPVVPAPTIPDAPNIGSASGSNGSAIVTWTAPASDGGNSITAYTVTAADSTTPANGGETCGWTTGLLTCTVAGLTNGDSYTFTVTATNGLGTGPASAASNPVVPMTVPDAPTIGTATGGNASASVTWSPPVSDGGSLITGYTVTAADATTPGNGGETCGWASGPLTCKVTGLTNGDSYTFSVTATNAAGAGAASAASNPVVPMTVPDAPTIGTATGGNASASVTWSPPVSDGGNSITGYTVTAADATTPGNGGESCSWTSGPLTCTVAKLTNGDSYTFSVTATNAAGAGAASAASNPVVPMTVPGAPTIGTATGGNTTAIVTWTAPASDGGNSITGYTVTAADATTPGNGGESCSWTSGPLSCTVAKLTNGDSYTFSVTATNAAGAGAASAASNPVVPMTVPGAPTIGTATGGNTTASVTWTAPVSDGGNSITGYTVTAADATTPGNGGESCSWTSGPLTCTVAKLTNGDSYTFSVTATNAAGAGAASAASNPVVPMTVPGAPTIGTATGGNTTAIVTWTAPVSDGGNSITGYTVTAADATTPGNGGESCSWTSGPLTCTVAKLTNGDSYTFSVTATNAAGAGAASAASNPVVPMTVPGAPTIGTATGGNTTAIVTWTAPVSDGGNSITGYTVTAADSTTPGNGGESCSWTSGPLTCTVAKLTNGDSYTFSVTATNAAGAGAASAASNPVVPMTVPGAPTIGTATGGNTTAIVTWTAPVSDGGNSITGYTVTAADSTTPGNGGESCSWTSGPLTCTVAKLTNGDSYTFSVTATNAAGAGAASAASNPVVPMTVPGAPTIGTATGGNTTAIVTWTAPVSDGGNSITGYTVTAADSTSSANGGESCSWTSGPLTCTVAKLTNGDSYTFSVTATNAAGAGAASAASNPVVPMTVPGAPTIGTATGGNTTAIVTWTAPASDGGSLITGYTVTATDATSSANGGETCSWTSGPLTCTVAKLTNGDSYTFSVTATNSVGAGAASAASNPVVPMTVPDAPTIGTAARGNASASVAWTAPASDGGSLITGYTVTAADATTPTNGGESCTWTSGPLTCTVAKLTNGDSYTFTVTATNSVGAGAASAASNPVVPATVPGAPTIGTATGSNASATVTWTAPVSDGGFSITGYTVTAADGTVPANGGETCSWTTGPLTCTVAKLTNGDSYTFTVTATNSVGAGLASAASVAVTPATIPGAPTIGTAIRGSASATVTWSAPVSDGGSAITGYTVTAADSTTPTNGGETCGWTSGPLGCTVAKLTNGDSYTFTVTATNAVGAGPASAASVAVTPAAVPGRPTIGTATRGNASASVTWSAPASDGGSPITGYVITTYLGSDPLPTVSVGKVTSDTVGGLTNGVSYTFTVAARNAAGTGAPSSGSNAVTPATVPDAPTIVGASGGAASVTLTWTAPADGGSTISGYDVFVGTGAGTISTSPVDPSPVAGTSYTVGGLAGGETYYFVVTALNSLGQGPASNVASAAPPVTDHAVLSTHVVGMAATPDGGGYWLTDTSGAVSTHGDAVYYGSMAGVTLNAPISHIVATPDGKGYWLVAQDGGTFAFGDAGFYGSMGGQPLNAPVVDIAPTADGRGYWLVASDGGIFAFGDAAFQGSMGGIPLNQPVVGISADFATGGYWEVASDGGIFAFGAPFFGSTGSIRLNRPVNGMAASPDDRGYLFVASDGGIFAFGDAGFYGSMGGSPLSAPIVGMAVDRSTGGYWLVGADGKVFAFGAPFYGLH